jgi:hypothetical protein
MRFHGRLEHAVRLRVGFGNEDVALHADTTPPENSGFGCAGAPRFASACLKVVILALAMTLDPSVT